MTTHEQAKNKKCSQHFYFADLIDCGRTVRNLNVDNRPLQSSSYLALEDLAINILDPIKEQFKLVKLTYGFASHNLVKLIPRAIAPKIDQHSSFELNSKGNLICDRGGAAVDLFVPGLDSLKLADWISANIPFDRLYYYGSEKSIHVSYTNAGKRLKYLMASNDRTGRLIPRKVRNFSEEAPK